MIHTKITFIIVFMTSSIVSSFSQTILDAAFFQSSYADMFISAQHMQKPMILFFSANGSDPSLKMEKETLSDEYVASFMSLNYLAKKVDIRYDEGLQLVNHFKVKRFPTILFLDHQGKVKTKMEGFYQTDYFLKVLLGLQFRQSKYRQHNFESGYDVYLSSL